MIVKPKKQKEVNHENLASYKDLDRLSRDKLEKKNTVRAYKWIINKFCADFGGDELTELPTEKVLQFFNIVTEGCKPQTKRVRFSHLSSFFNFLKNNLDLNFENPCNLPMLRKLFRPIVTVRWNIIEKETVDEIIFRTTNVRNRLILELMARGGMRIGEVLKLRFSDLQDRKLIKKIQRAEKNRRLYLFPEKWPTGCGNTRGKTVIIRMTESFQFRMKLPG